MNRTSLYSAIALATAALAVAGCTKPNQAPVAPEQLPSPQAEPSPAPATVPPSTPPVATPPAAPALTMAVVAQHANRSSCYSAINGTVYDLTSWIDRHPGGPQRILSICGRDGSSAFSGQHAGQPQPAQVLAGFEVGVLAQ